MFEQIITGLVSAEIDLVIRRGALVADGAALEALDDQGLARSTTPSAAIPAPSSNPSTSATIVDLLRGYIVAATGRRHVPFLRLSGRWLERAGFAIGRGVRVEVSEGRLLIEPVD